MVNALFWALTSLASASSIECRCLRRAVSTPMGLGKRIQLGVRRSGAVWLARRFVFAWMILSTAPCVVTQAQIARAAESTESVAPENSAQLRAQRFLAGRVAVDGSAAQTMDTARSQHATLATQQTVMPRAVSSMHTVSPRLTGLDATWQPVGPAQVLSAAYGKVTGRVTSIAIDAGDVTGNTV